MSKTKVVFCLLALFLVAFLASACQGGGKVSLPEDLQETVQKTWEHYKWYEENNGFPRGGGWHLKPGDESKTFEITQAKQGNVPDELKVLMSVGSSGYQGDVWCVTVQPALYFGQGKEVDEKIAFQNMLFFQRKDGRWVELGNVWKERWVAFMYDPDVYRVSVNFYLGTNQKMYEKVGCDNWQAANQ